MPKINIKDIKNNKKIKQFGFLDVSTHIILVCVFFVIMIILYMYLSFESNQNKNQCLLSLKTYDFNNKNFNYDKFYSDIKKGSIDSYYNINVVPEDIAVTYADQKTFYYYPQIDIFTNMMLGNLSEEQKKSCSHIGTEPTKRLLLAIFLKHYSGTLLSNYESK